MASGQTIFETRALRANRFPRLMELLARPRADFIMILATTALLVGIGEMMVLSSSSVFAAGQQESGFYFLGGQFKFLLIGIPVAWVASRLSVKAYTVVSFLAMAGSIIMLTLIFTPLGVAKFGNRSWLSLGFVEFQPSEFAKLSLILWSASVFANRERTINQPKRLLMPFLLGFGVIIGLVLLQRDLGTTLIIGVIMFAMLWFVGAPLKVFGILGTLSVVGVGLLVLLNPERIRRFTTFLSGGQAAGSSDQPTNAIYGLASGGWWGVGLGASRQKWGGLYNGAQTDYVFAVLGEEIGLFGSLVVIAAFGILGYAGMRTALRCRQPFYRYAAGGITAWITLQAVLNIAVVMHLLPVFGVPLPFISHGGTALVSNLAAIGVLLAAARNEPGALLDAKSNDLRRPKLISVVDKPNRKISK